MVKSKLFVCHTDYKTSPVWEVQMLSGGKFIVSGHSPNDPRHALMQIEQINPGKIIILHRNSGDAISGIIALGIARTGATVAQPMSQNAKPLEYIRSLDVDEWLVLENAISHATIENALGAPLSPLIQKTVSPFEGAIAEKLFKLFFSVYNAEQEAKQDRKYRSALTK
jgi:hypothetical protein